MDGTLIDRCLGAPTEELGPLFEEAYRLSRARFSNSIRFYAPGMVHYETPFHRATSPHRFPAISITGGGCQLGCEHCRGRLLEAMIPADTPEKLLEVCARIHTEGGSGCLISGGSTEGGEVPLLEFAPAIGRVKRELGLDIVVHTGVIRPDTARELADAGIDAAMVDVIGSEETLRRVYHLDMGIDAIERSLTLLQEGGVPIVPHIVVGLHYGRLMGERRAVEVVSRHGPAAVVVVAFTPLDRTPMGGVAPPSPLEIARVALSARLVMPGAPLLLGCARPRGRHRSRTDVLAIRAGVNGMAYPSVEGYRFAKRMGLRVKFSEECCSLIHREGGESSEERRGASG